MKRDNPFSAYVLVSQLTFIIITPLLVFIWGGKWLVETLSLPNWVHGILIVTGIIITIGGTVRHLMVIIKTYDNGSKPTLLNDVKDFDYYQPRYKKKNNQTEAKQTASVETEPDSNAEKTL
jgi:hypothetical protein